jgi:HK97 family phage prohead protease
MNTKQFISESEKTFNDDELTISHYISSITPDRYGDIVNPSGMDATNYAKNPVVLFGHRSNSLVIGKNLELQVRHNGVSAVTKFADTEQGREIYKLNRDGFLNAWSIGFIPKKEVEKKDEISGKVYNHIEEWELLEYSSVPIPANPDCLNLMLKDLQDCEIKNILEESNESLIHFNQLSATISALKVDITDINSKLLNLESKVSHKLFDLIKFIKSL